MSSRSPQAGKKRETIRKSVKYLAAVLDDAGIDPNPARVKRIRLPHEEPVELEPPTSRTRRGRLPAARALLPAAAALARLVGRPVASVETALVGDYDEPQPPGPAAGVDDEDAGGALGRATRRARRRARGVPAAA